MIHLKKSLLTLVALLALTTQAWAGIALGDVYKFGSQITFDGSTVVWFKVFSGGAETITTGIHTTQTLTYGGYNSGKHTLTFPSGDGASFMYIVDDNPAEPWGIQVSSGQGTVGNPFVLTAIYDAPLIYHNSSDDAWFVNMPAGNVELQVEYYPGMLVKPTNLVGGTMEIEGLTDTTLPEGFEKDDDGNIYVAKDTKFTVKAVPAEGYHLVGWSDDATNKELEREFTMTDDDFILTATFSDEYDLAFQALNANTIEDGKATVKVGDTDKTATLIQDGKLSMKSGQTVTLTATQGYKFRSVEATKGIVKLLSITVGAVTIYYAEGENWTDAINRAENKDSGLFIREGNRVHHPDYGQLVDSNTQPVLPDAKINANESYRFIK